MGAQIPRSVLQDYTPNTQTRVSWFAQKVSSIKCRFRMSLSSTTTRNHTGLDTDIKIRAAGGRLGNRDDAHGYEMETMKSGMSQRTTMLGNIVVGGYTVNVLNKWDHGGDDGDLVLDYEKPTRDRTTRKFPFGFGKKDAQVSQPFFKLPAPSPASHRTQVQRRSPPAEAALAKDSHVRSLFATNHTAVQACPPTAPVSSELNDDKVPGLTNSVNIDTYYDATPIPKPHAHPTPSISSTAAAAYSSISLNRHRQAQRPVCSPITPSSSSSSDSDRSYVTAASHLVPPLKELPDSSVSTSATPTPNSDTLRYPTGKAREMKWSRDVRLSLTLPLDILPNKSTATRPPTLDLDHRNTPNARYDSSHTEGLQKKDLKGKGKLKPWQSEHGELDEAIDTDTDKTPTLSESTLGSWKGYYQDYVSSKSIPLSKATDVKTRLHGVPFPTVQSLPPSSFASTSLRPQGSSASSSTWDGPSRLGVGTTARIGIESRSSIYKHTSRSMLEFRPPLEEEPSQRCSSRVGQPTADDVGTTLLSLPRGKRKHHISKPPPYLAVVEVRRTEPKEIYLPKLSSRRRHSLPTFNSTADPPPYPSLFPRHNFRIEPRDDEGRERLPQYTNHIFMCGVVPMKMEFLSAGVQAGDRRWRKVVCVLEGTSFKVYKHRPVVHSSVLGDWWRSRRSRAARDPAGPSTSAVNVASGSQVNEASGSHGVAPTRSRFSHLASLFKPEHVHTRSEGDSTAPSSTTTPTFRPFLIPPRNSNDSSGSASSDFGESSQHPSVANIGTAATQSIRTTRPSSSVAHERVSPTPSDTPNLPSERPSRTRTTIVGIGTAGRPGPLQPPSETGELLRTYSLQRAVAGFAYDYTKRKNAIRVRLDGEQFLMQTSGMVELVAWVEALQAGADVALDLDERPMPRGPRLPRGRRRPPPRRPLIEAPLPEVSQHTSISTDTTC